MTRDVRDVRERERIAIALVDRFLDGELPFASFKADFVAEADEFMGTFAVGESVWWEFISGVDQRLEWAVERPSRDDRRDGYIDPVDFKRWLQNFRSSASPGIPSGSEGVG